MNRLFSTIFIIFIFLSGCNKENNFPKGKWKKLSDFPGEVSHPLVSFVINDKGYVLTWSNRQSGFYEFDPIKNSWHQKASLPVFIQSSTGFAINGKGYLMTSTVTNEGDVLQEVWAYDPSNDTWTRKKDFPGEGRYDAVAFTIDSKGYLGTGEATYSVYGRRLSDWWQYDPLPDAWTQKQDFPGGPCSLAVATAAGTKGFMGISGTGRNPGKQWWGYDPASDIWTRKADFQGEPRFAASIFVINNFCYVGNGGINGGNNPSTFLYDWWKYDIASDKWIEVAPQVNERYVGAGFAINGFGYLGLGVNTESPNLLKDFWRFDPR